ncbi:ATP-binding protein [Streptomyces sp. NPDC051840]|uniref:ATP-binding protein n=1 Tax=Streptomyces sp. NPDC051840 TaxID=3154752 RepID=UPI003418E7FF
MCTNQHQLSPLQYVLAEITFPSEPKSVGRARDWVSGVYTSRGVPTDVVELLTSEIVTNAVIHGTGDVTVRVLGSLWVEVSDASPVIPERRVAAEDDTGGRGLELMEALAEQFEVRPAEHGKCVAFLPGRGDCA